MCSISLRQSKPVGVIVQFGGQTPLKLALDLEAAGIPVLGTSPEKIDLAEDRERFKGMLNKLGLKQPPNDVAISFDQARQIARDIYLPCGSPSVLRSRRQSHGDRL